MTPSKETSNIGGDTGSTGGDSDKDSMVAILAVILEEAPLEVPMTMVTETLEKMLLVMPPIIMEIPAKILEGIPLETMEEALVAIQMIVLETPAEKLEEMPVEMLAIVLVIMAETGVTIPMIVWKCGRWKYW